MSNTCKALSIALLMSLFLLIGTTVVALAQNVLCLVFMIGTLVILATGAPKKKTEAEHSETKVKGVKNSKLWSCFSRKA